MFSFRTNHKEFIPSKDLQRSIKCFWYDKIEYGKEQSSFEVVPDGYAEIIFYFGNELSISYKDGLKSLPSPFIMGLLNQPAVFNSIDSLEIIGIRCYPWTVFDLLGLSSKKGKDGVQVFEHPIAKLQSVLSDLIRLHKIEEAITKVEDYFLKTQSQGSSDALLSIAGAAMTAAGGSLPVSQIAAASHTTVRTLERNFKESSGYTVKDVSSLMRFEQVRNRLWLEPNLNIASLAQELGYSDQSHLSREFKRYSGTTPGVFARKAKQQTIDNDFVAFIQS
ncbi:helix-turn-helix domain-containing protein [Flavobacterium collinsii]|jgi:AraC-like DNA-binding protein|uniref:AraC family transcriptional regulator n=1 Tax=Flavobacterium collinsii TaxID=1114861 RepID=A0A9W4TK90_9FLAO|nr:helix-turn-helix domain-containing protein [Flavobacterium collinsii]CAI2768442.1 AraC family transcriptional regulator [Flavobacterium collinsii]